MLTTSKIALMQSTALSIASDLKSVKMNKKERPQAPSGAR